MIKQPHLLKNALLLVSILMLTACEKNNLPEKSKAKITHTTKVEIIADSAITNNKVKNKETTPKLSSSIEEISWNKLVPADYDPMEVLGGLIEQLNNLEDNDPKALAISGKIQAEFDNAPINENLNGKMIKMPGFIAPLENNNGVISEFLLVPYFGACIHVPPPPVNQTVMIKAGKNQGIKSEDSMMPVWITGKLETKSEKTDIGAAGYRIENAVVEPYQEI